MKTNFFETIGGLPFTGNLNLTIGRQADGILAVSVLVVNEQLSDKAAKAIPPLLLKGTATELDEGFFEAISKPLQSTAQLFANMAEYQKGLDAAKLNSKQELDKKSKSAKAKTAAPADDNDPEESGQEDEENLFSQPKEDDTAQRAEKKRLYDEAMGKVTELNGQCKYEEALSVMPLIAEYPDKEAEITRKTNELKKRKEMYDSLKQDL